MLQDDRHLFGVLLAQTLRQDNAGCERVERDVEVVVAGQAFFSRLGQDGAHDVAHRFLRKSFVVDHALAVIPARISRLRRYGSTRT